MNPPESCYPSRPDEIEPVTYPDRLVLIDPVTGRLAQLDPVAALVWLYADGTRTCAEIAAAIAEAKPDLDAGRVREVVGTLVDNAFLTLD